MNNKPIIASSYKSGVENMTNLAIVKYLNTTLTKHLIQNVTLQAGE